jgi:xanthine dehydrogenase accessory factor
MSHSGNKKPSTLVTEGIERVLDEGGVAALAALIEAPTGVGAKLLVQVSSRTAGSLGDSELDRVVSDFAAVFLASRDDAHVFQVKEFSPDLAQWSEARILFERIQPEPRLVICGAGHVGAALAKLASFIGYRATVIDDRAEFVTRAHFPDEKIELIAANKWAAAVTAAIGNGHGVSVAVVTRGHNEDEECMQAVITTNADYIGLIGSKRRTNIVLDRLRDAGANEEQLKNVHAPVGLDIGAVTPEEVALAILSEVVAERRGGKGGSLSSWRRQ